MGKMPPERITEAGLRVLRVRPTWLGAGAGHHAAPHRDRRDRQAAMILAHLMYGTVLGKLTDKDRTIG